MNKFYLLSLLAAVLAVAAGEYVDYGDQVLDAEMVKALEKDAAEARQECATLQSLSMGPKTRAGFPADKLKEMCKCTSDHECQCCAGKEFKIPIIGTYTFRVCSVLTVNAAAKSVNFKVTIGPITAMNKDVSYSKYEEVCKKIEKFKHMEFCMKSEVTEDPAKGLRLCITVQANIMDIFNKPLYFPCLNFKNQKLTMDDNMNDYKDDGIRINLKGLWNKFKNLFG